MKIIPIILFHVMFIVSFLAYVVLGINIQNGIISYVLLFIIYFFSIIFSNRKLYSRTNTLLDFVVFSYIFFIAEYSEPFV